MPIRKPVLSPPFNVVRVSHVELSVRDLAASRAFYVDCLGYLVSDETADALYLRAVEERNHHSIVLRRDSTAGVQTIGFKVASEDDLDRAAFWFARKGLPTSFPEVPHQGRTLRTADALGMPLDLYFRMEQAESMLRRYSAYRGARIQRIDHVNGFTRSGFARPSIPRPMIWIRSCGRSGCTARATCTTLPSPTARGRGCTTSACGRRARSTSCTSAT
jgi:catechol 2,3-dioxygenase-like lactoylglutathione lyase family enzyme